MKLLFPVKAKEHYVTMRSEPDIFRACVLTFEFDSLGSIDCKIACSKTQQFIIMAIKKNFAGRGYSLLNGLYGDALPERGNFLGSRYSKGVTFQVGGM